MTSKPAPLESTRRALSSGAGLEVIGQAQRENEALKRDPEGSDRPDQLYLHSNVPALVAIFIRFRRRGARTAGGAAAGRPRRVRRNRMNIVTRAGTLEWRCPPE